MKFDPERIRDQLNIYWLFTGKILAHAEHNQLGAVKLKGEKIGSGGLVGGKKMRERVR